MSPLSRLRSVFGKRFHKKEQNTGPPAAEPQNNDNHLSDENLEGLSEVAAPRPVENSAVPRRNSLERVLEGAQRH